jgi:hypothetical protein
MESLSVDDAKMGGEPVMAPVWGGRIFGPKSCYRASAHMVGSQPDKVCRTGTPASLKMRSAVYSPVCPSTNSRRRSAWPLWRAYSSIMWQTTHRTLAGSTSGGGRRTTPPSPSDRSTSPSAARERATFCSHNAHNSSGALPAERHAQSEPHPALSHGGAMSRPRS